MALVADISWTVNTSKGSLTVTKVHELRDRANQTWLTNAAHQLLADGDVGGNGLINFLGGSGIAGIKYGSYTGDGGASQDVPVGFAPDFAVVFSENAVAGLVLRTAANQYWARVSSTTGQTVVMALNTGITFHATDGFTMYGTSTDGFNVSGVDYSYLAVKF